MLTVTRKRILFPLICAVLALLLAFCTWLVINNQTSSQRLMGSVDMPIYSSIQGLSSAPGLDIVVIGKVQGIAGHEVDFGGENPTNSDAIGIPNVFYNVEVTDVLRGVVDKTIVVAMPDNEKIIFASSVTGWKAGEQLLLFLSEQNPKNAPGIKMFDHFYAPMSLDNGVFDVLPGDLAKPRMPKAFLQTTTGNPNESITFKLSEIREMVLINQ